MGTVSGSAQFPIHVGPPDSSPQVLRAAGLVLSPGQGSWELVVCIEPSLGLDKSNVSWLLSYIKVHVFGCLILCSKVYC